MGELCTSILERIGQTPLLELGRLGERLGLRARVLAKLEGCNPGGSAKDRVALAMIRDGEARGLLRPGAAIIEPTSGNTGIGLAMAGRLLGYRVVIVMPDTMSPERRILMQAYGAQVVLTPGALGMAGAIQRAQELREQIPGSFIPDQFSNPANPRVHFETTGPELWRDAGGAIDAFVAGVGTGGTITGAGRYLKSRNPALRVIAVEPAGSPVLSGGAPGPHGLQGIGAGFVPKALDTTVYDEVFPVTEAEAFAAARLLAETEGVLAGISSGAALHAAAAAAARPEYEGRTLAVLLPDTGERYLSTGLFSSGV